MVRRTEFTMDVEGLSALAERCYGPNGALQWVGGGTEHAAGAALSSTSSILLPVLPPSGSRGRPFVSADYRMSV